MLSRRQLLTLLAALPLARSAAAATRTPPSVIVIGAGIAGLAAARMLADSGARVIVLDARRRPGGRIATSRAWPDLPIELGANWIHGIEGNPMTALADAVGARRVVTSYDASELRGPDGRILDIDDVYARAERLFERARDALPETGADVSLATAITAHEDWQRGSSSQRRIVRHYVNSMVEQEYAGDWQETSARYFDSDHAYDGPDVLLPDGYDRLVQHLARGLDVRLGQRVSSVARVPAGARVTLQDGSTLTAERVVVTLPLGVLRAGTVQFLPALAAPRLDAIERLRMGLLNKCVLRFDRAHWPARRDWIEWLGPRDGYWSQWLSLARAAQQPVLVAFNAGAQARELEALDDAATIDAAGAALRAMFGERFPAPLAARVTRWGQDPCSVGSYTFNAVGVSADTRAALAGADWDGVLQFAGEATSTTRFGTTDGALMSGRAAATALLADGTG